MPPSPVHSPAHSLALPLAEVAEPPATRVSIVGGGAAGVMAAAHLFRTAGPDRPLAVTVVDRHGEAGPGLPYRTRDPWHRLNNYAGRLSAIHGQPDHLLAWCAKRGLEVTNRTFLPRATYGDYLRGVFDSIDVPPGSSLAHTLGTAVDLRDSDFDGGLELALADGQRIGADHVVLALGTPPPRRPEGDFPGWTRDSVYVPDPWRLDVDEVGAPRRILLIGTGLTAADLAATLHETFGNATITAVSRGGRLPHPHRLGQARPHDLFHPGHGSLDQVLASVAERVHEVNEYGGEWRDVIDAVRGYANDVWQRWSLEDQERFVRRHARDWELARHRMAPELASHLDDLRAQGILQVGRVGALDGEPFDLVVNCTGPAPTPSRGWNRLIDTLLDRGRIAPHRLGLGLDLDAAGHPLGSDGTGWQRVHVMGAARRGLEWEVAAVPDLRAQASAVSAAILAVGTQPAHRTA